MKTEIDKTMLEDELVFAIKDKEIMVKPTKRKFQLFLILVDLDQQDVPTLLSNTRKIQKLGFEINYTLEDMIEDQLNYYLKKENRE